MEITHDHSYVSRKQRELISRGYAQESVYSLRFGYILTEAQQAENRAAGWDACAAAMAQRASGHMERVAATLARNFKICQYDDREDIPFSSDWDLFFWCNDFSSTMRGLLAGRDYRYFTLSFNKKHGPERRQKIHDRAMRILELFAGDGNLHVAVQYEAVLDDARIKHDAKLAIPGIAGRKCVYGGMEGTLETNGESLFFRKKRSRKHIYKLEDADILVLSWRLSA